MKANGKAIRVGVAKGFKKDSGHDVFIDFGSFHKTPEKRFMVYVGRQKSARWRTYIVRKEEKTGIYYSADKSLIPVEERIAAHLEQDTDMKPSVATKSAIHRLIEEVYNSPVWETVV
jgi:hypothetical protein